MSLVNKVLQPKSYFNGLRAKFARVRHDDRIARNRTLPILHSTVLYESYDGSGVVCSPAAIFNALLTSADYLKLNHVWVLRNDIDILEFRRNYADRPNVSCVKYRSVKYFELLGCAEYLINNSTFPAEFMKRSGQIYVNTWHGVPVKRMGYDVPNGRADVRNVIRNFLATDYLVSSGPKMTELMYKNAFKLSNLYAGTILESGQPRTDAHYFQEELVEQTRNRLRDNGFEIDGRRIVLFAPTWRGGNAYSVDAGVEGAYRTTLKLQELLGKDYLVISKFHQLVERKLSPESLSGIGVVDSTWDTNHLLSMCDHLVTDYSSSMFDYLSLDRRVHFYIPEDDDFEETRGLYRAAEEFPGKVSYSIEALVADIRSDESEEYSLRREAWRELYVPYDDGGATARVIRSVFAGRSEPSTDVVFPQPKKKILLHVGSLIPNGITTAALNLVKNLDYDLYDVTVIYPYSAQSYQLSKSLELDARVRLLPRVGRIAMRVRDRRSYWAFTKGGGAGAGKRHVRKMKVIFENEFRRCAGDATFDVVLGFDGYQVFWTELLLHGGAEQKFLWAHNDLSLDSHRIVDGRKPHLANLSSVFTLYSKFDGIVSVTEQLSQINRGKLLQYSDKNSFVSVRNFLDPDEILRKSETVIGKALVGRGPNFVTVGRLSPEKNQARIIRSFATVCRDFPDAKLILVGDGPLRGHLHSLVSKLGIVENVEFTGLLSNPYPFVRAADCFVFASEYEGQGLAILEALVLRVPVITTRFNVVTSVLAPEDGVIVEASDNALSHAMREFAVNGLPEPTFDAAKYNDSVQLELADLLNV